MHMSHVISQQWAMITHGWRCLSLPEIQHTPSLPTRSCPVLGVLAVLMDSFVTPPKSTSVRRLAPELASPATTPSSDTVLACRLCNAQSTDPDPVDSSKTFAWGRHHKGRKSGMECRYCVRLHARDYGTSTLNELEQMTKNPVFYHKFMSERDRDISQQLRGRTLVVP